MYDVQFESTFKLKKRKKKERCKESGQLNEQGLTSFNLQKPKRTKERLVHEIIDKVSTWRQLYKGISVPNESDPTKQVDKKLSLEEAAAKVGVTKKSLDDYLLQLRFGRKFGYDFEANKNSKVGELRQFVREEKDKLRVKLGKRKISSKYDESECAEKKW